jgi:hypothetical protein
MHVYIARSNKTASLCLNLQESKKKTSKPPEPHLMLCRVS